MLYFIRIQLNRSSHVNHSEIELFMELLKDIEDNNSSSTPVDNAIVSSVISYPENVKLWLKQKYNLLELNKQTPLPIKISYETPETLGNDRIALAVAGTQLYPGE